MPEKTCFKCGTIRPLSEFYPHPKMADGHLGKCKHCTRADSNARRQIKLSDPKWVDQEKARKLDHYPQKRHQQHGLPFDFPPLPKLTQEQSRLRKQVAQSVCNAIRDKKMTRLPCCICNSLKSQGHHEDYAKPFEVQWLCAKHHAARHQHLWIHRILQTTPLSIEDFLTNLHTQHQAGSAF